LPTIGSVGRVFDLGQKEDDGSGVIPIPLKGDRPPA
jgi:hypothetical protein